MATKSRRSKRRENVLSSLDVATNILNITKEILSVTPAKAACGAVSVILVTIKESMIDEMDYVELGVFCANICGALARGMNGKKLDDFSPSLYGAISRLTTTVADIQENVIERSRRNPLSRLIRARTDKEMIAAWNSDLNKILAVFHTELMVNSHTRLDDLHQNMIETRGDADIKNWMAQSSMHGESPPPPPLIFFGRDRLIDEIVGFAERLAPVALIGAGGIGKTSTALTVLYDDRIKQQFGEDRRFICCDKFPASLPHFLRQLSKATGAGIENPKDLTSLQPLLSSKDMIIVLDKAEYILDLQGTNAREIYAVVEELSQMSNICLCITSRISTVPPDCRFLGIPTLSMEAAYDTFYRIHEDGERSDIVTDILRQLDFHPLSVTLLATVAQRNRWSADRLASEWDKRRTDMLRTHGKSLAVTVELSLSSLMFQELGPNARDLLEVVAFFPQGVHKDNIDSLFPTIADRKNIFDKLCDLSLTYRNDGFITMLAPFRDYLSPKDPTSAPLLRSTKESYFSRLSVDVDFEPGKPGFEETRWIVSEDVNVEHLLNVFTTTDAASRNVWDVCAYFLKHLHWHKPRPATLGPKIEALPDDHPSKLECLLQLSRLSRSVGNYAECRRLLTHTLELSRERGDDYRLARTLRYLSRIHSVVRLYGEGIRQAKEALEISEQLGDQVEQARCLIELVSLLRHDKQLGAAEESALRAIDLVSEKGQEFLLSKCHHTLGNIYQSKGDTRKAIHHFEVALGIASSFNWLDFLFWTHFSIAYLFSEEGRFDDAQVHIEHAKSHAVNNHDTYLLARVMKLQARFWYKQDRLGEAKSEALRVVDVFEKLGAATDAEDIRDLLQRIEPSRVTEEMESNGDGRLTESERWYRRFLESSKRLVLSPRPP